MLFSRNWIARYVELPGSVDELARRLTAAGLAVEGIEEKGGDVLLDIDVTTNRPDCMNHLGIAREVAVITGRPLRPPEVAVEEGATGTSEAVRVRIEDREGCPRYVARVVRGVRVGPSPAWLGERLRAIGLRPINNVVDVTNFVLWELGQPLHAFDLARLEGAEIRVRRARAGEVLVTLDEEQRRLDEEVLVIADARRPVALAGVMGGRDSEVGDRTSDILLESAHFDRRRVRIAARKLGMHTDASHRFERGADPEVCAAAADRAAALIAELAGGEVLAGALDVRGETNPDWPPRGRLELAALEGFAGCEIGAASVARWLEGLGFALHEEGEGAWEVAVPSWRYYDFDVRPEPPHRVYPADLYEEVLRLHGYDAIPSALPAISGADAPRTASQRRRERVRDQLAAEGFAEAVNFAFYDEAADRSCPHLGGGEPVELANPLSERYRVLRRSLVPSLLDNARFNRRRGAAATRLFEIGHVFGGDGRGAVEEQEVVGLVAGGELGTPWDRTVELDLFDLKGVVESLGRDVLGVEIEARPASLPGLVEGAAAELVTGGKRIGWLGRVDEEEGAFALFAAEIVPEVVPLAAEELEVEVPSRFPGIAADLTLTHSTEVSWAEVRAAVLAARPPLLEEFGLKDRYEGEGVPEGAVKTTLYFLYSSPERSLTQEEINETQAALAAELERRFGWDRGPSEGQE